MDAHALAAPPDADGLRGLSDRLARHGEAVRAAIESMNGARFVHDRLELAGWQVEIADAQKVKGLAPLASFGLHSEEMKEPNSGALRSRWTSAPPPRTVPKNGRAARRLIPST